MNSDTIRGELKQLSGKIKQKIGDLTGDHVQKAEGKKDELTGKVQAEYGKVQDKASAVIKELKR